MKKFSFMLMLMMFLLLLLGYLPGCPSTHQQGGAPPATQQGGASSVSVTPPPVPSGAWIEDRTVEWTTITTESAGKPLITILFNIVEPTVQPRKLTDEELQKRIEEASRKISGDLTVEKINNAVSSVFSQKPPERKSHILMAGPFLRSQFDKFVERLNGAPFLLKEGSFQAKKFEGVWVFQTLDPDALIPYIRNKGSFPVMKTNVVKESGKILKSIIDLANERGAKRFLKKLWGNGCTRYTVKPGDTLYSISGKFYGDPSYWRALNKFNFGNQSGTEIYVGQELAIPPLYKLK